MLSFRHDREETVNIDVLWIERSRPANLCQGTAIIATTAKIIFPQRQVRSRQLGPQAQRGLRRLLCEVRAFFGAIQEGPIGIAMNAGKLGVGQRVAGIEHDGAFEQLGRLRVARRVALSTEDFHAPTEKMRSLEVGGSICLAGRRCRRQCCRGHACENQQSRQSGHSDPRVSAQPLPGTSARGQLVFGWR